MSLSAKERNYQKNKKALRDALNRLEQSKPTHPILKKRAALGKLKINDSTVQTEANLSAGVLRNHEDVAKEIKEAVLAKKVLVDESIDDPIELLQKELETAKKYGTTQARLKNKHLKDARRDKDALAVQAANHAKTMERMIMIMPYGAREKAMEEIVTHKFDNVVSLK